MDPRLPVRTGQPLKLAADHVNWLNQHMSLDTGFRAGLSIAAAPSALVVPCDVSSTVSGVAPGYVVRILSDAASKIPTAEDPAAAARAFGLSGQVSVPPTLNNYEDAKKQLGVIVGGSRMPQPGTPRVALVCIAGLCVARVRPRYAVQSNLNVGPYQFLSAAIKRTENDTDAKLTGAGEASSCGTHRIITYLGDADPEGFLKFAVVLM